MLKESGRRRGDVRRRLAKGVGENLSIHPSGPLLTCPFFCAGSQRCQREPEGEVRGRPQEGNQEATSN